MVFMKRLLARTMFARSITVLGRRLGAEKPQEQVSPRKGPTFLKFYQPVALGTVALSKCPYGL